MGSILSGRWGDYKKKQTAENCYKLNINMFCKNGELVNGSSGNFNYGERFKGTYRITAPFTLRIESGTLPLDALITLHYEIRGESIISPLYVSSSPANFGNKRYWVLCPALKRDGRPCLKRGYKLYLPQRERYFCCRECYDLTYNSVQRRDKRVNELLNNPEKYYSALYGETNSSKSLSAFFLALKALEKEGNLFNE